MINIGVVGDRGVGSKSLARTFAEGEYRDLTLHAQRREVYSKVINVDGKSIRIGFEAIDQFERTLPRKDGYMLVYDVTDRKSFENLQEHWIPLSERYIGGGWSVGRIIVGSKAEMNSKRQVSKEEGKEYADSIDVPFFEVSARTGYNVTDAFTQLARETIAREKPKQYQREGPVDLTMFRAEEQPTSKCIIS